MKLICCLLAVIGTLLPSFAQERKKLLLVTVTMGFPHSSIPLAEKTLVELGKKSGAFEIADVVRSGPRPKNKADETAWEEKAKADLAAKMSPTALRAYDGIIFANTTGVLPLPDKQAFLDFVKSGKAFIAMHSGSDTFHGPNNTIDPYTDMLGAEFQTHGAQVGIECLVADRQHPAVKHLNESFCLEQEEVYLMKNYQSNQVHELLVLDKHPNNKKLAGHFPVAWCKKYGQGNVFYTSLGHNDWVWENKRYQQHILGGIKWALGMEAGDAQPNAASYFIKQAGARPPTGQ